MKNERCAVCTIASANYLEFVCCAFQSYIQHNPGQRFIALIVDEPDHFTRTEYPFEIVWVKDLPIADFLSITFQFDVLELNTNVKPIFLKYLLQRGDIDKLLYVDPDIYFYHSMDIVFDLLDHNSILLTPHCTTPINDRWEPSEQCFLRTGVFNLGFIGVRNCPEIFRMLDWWGERCLTRGYNEIPSGLFVDQKWMDLIPCFYASVYVLKHPGCNMAYWNLHERVLKKNAQGNWIVNDDYPLLFFHFSGIVVGDETSISKYQNRYTFLERPDLAVIFGAYRQCLLKNRKAILKNDYHYSYGCFSNGKTIPLFLRRMYGALRANFAGCDPFNAGGSFYHWADKQGLVGSGKPEEKYTALTYNKNDWRLKVIHNILRSLLRIVGVRRYTLLMRYLSFISILRNQVLLFDVKKSRPDIEA